MTVRKVLEEFHYAHDGINPRRVKAGQSVEFRDDAIPQLEREDKIEKGPAPLKPGRVRK